MPERVDAVIKVKRGPEDQRKLVTFDEGELAYSTDVKRLFIGDSVRAGGNPVTIRTHVGTSVPSYALSGDFFLQTNESYSVLYTLTGNDYYNLSAYAPMVRSDLFTTVADNSASWYSGGVNTTVATYSAAWESTYATVNQASAVWSAGGGGGGGGVGYPDQLLINTYFKISSGAWNSTYSTVKTISAGAAILSSATVQTYSQPLTASGKFLLININGTPQAIRLWDV
jgi:hypothetical protein